MWAKAGDFLGGTKKDAKGVSELSLPLIKRALSERRDYFQLDSLVGGINQSAAFRRDPLAAAIFISLRLREVPKVTISLVQMRILAGGAVAAREKLSFNQECTPTLIWTKLVKGAMFAETERESSVRATPIYDQDGSL